MRKDKIVKLIKTSINKNEIASSTLVDDSVRSVCAEKKSIKRVEFYQAATTGFKPELTFVVWAREYDEESVLEYEGKRYDIIRSFEPNSEETELVCSRLH